MTPMVRRLYFDDVSRRSFNGFENADEIDFQLLNPASRRAAAKAGVGAALSHALQAPRSMSAAGTRFWHLSANRPGL